MTRCHRLAWVLSLLLPVVLAPTHAAADDAGAGPPRPPTFAVSTFATVPSPGHPFGVLVCGDRVHVSTSAGHPLYANPLGEALFTYDRAGTLLTSVPVPVSDPYMGLGGFGVDGSQQVFVTDMNGLAYRIRADGTPVLWAEAPAPYAFGKWRTSMWNDIDFDPNGNAYITDGFPAGRIWRRTPSGELTIWFSDNRMMFAGPFQAQVDATGRYLYFASVVALWPDRVAAGALYRLPLKEKPGAADLEELHRWPPETGDAERGVGAMGPYDGAQTNGMALGRSGRIYVSVSGRDQLAVLDPDGKLIRTITSPLFHYPVYLAFLGDRLLVANQDASKNDLTGNDGSRWLLTTVDVADSAITPCGTPVAPHATATAAVAPSPAAPQAASQAGRDTTNASLPATGATGALPALAGWMTLGVVVVLARRRTSPKH